MGGVKKRGEFKTYLKMVCVARGCRRQQSIEVKLTVCTILYGCLDVHITSFLKENI